MDSDQKKQLPVWNDLEPASEERPESPLSGTLSRRTFLTALGVGGAASLAACQRVPVDKAISLIKPTAGIDPGVPTKYASTCTACPAACGLMATVLEGRPVKLEGLPGHPRSQGGLCAVGQGDLRALYDVDRQGHPGVTGKKSSWDALDRAVGEGLAKAKEAGKKVFILASTINSPTGLAAVSTFAASVGGTLVEYDPDPESSAATLDAYERLDGVARLPAPRLDQVDLLVSLASDFLGAGRDPVCDTAAYSARKREAEKRGALRHLQIEGTLSLTGAAADERWPASLRQRRLLSLELLRDVASGAKTPDAPALAAAAAGAPPSKHTAEVKELARELLRAGQRALVLTGDDDPVVQLAVALTNRLLGAEGASLHLDQPLLSRRGRDAGLIGLLTALEAGEVGALFLLDSDPVDQLPGGAELATAIKALPLSVAVTTRPTATAAACGIVAAANHGLEDWGDHLAGGSGGVLSLSQPALRPIFDTRPRFENFLRWSGVAAEDWYSHLRAEWKQKVIAGPAFEARWTAAVSSGLAPADATVPAKPAPAAAPAQPAALILKTALAALGSLEATDALEVELVAEVALREGGRAHVPWLRELPDPLTRATWVPCVRIAPALGKKLGVDNGDLLDVSVGDRKVRMPARLLPGCDPTVVGVPVGYGRADGDAERKDGNGYVLAGRGESSFTRRGLTATVKKAGGREELPLMQWHSKLEGRDYLQQVRAPEAHAHQVHVPEGNGLWDERHQLGAKWEMAIDLDRCTGCSACVVACQAENNIPVVGPEEMRRHRDMHWIRIDRYFEGPEENPDVLFQPMLCSQCDNAPCETVCPVAATVHTVDGLNQQVYNRCVGTRYCANNCPYKVRRFNWFDHEPTEPLERMVLNPAVVYRDRGVMEKCTYCSQRIQAARIDARGKGEGDSFEVSTACQQSCPAQAITFGNINDPETEIAEQAGHPRAFQALAELGIRPALTYLARIRNRAEAPGDTDHDDHGESHE